MVTEKQVEANRENCRQSTGSMSAEGVDSESEGKRFVESLGG